MLFPNPFAARPESFQPPTSGLPPEREPSVEQVTPVPAPAVTEAPVAVPEVTTPATPVVEAVSPTEAVSTTAPVTETPPAEPNDLHAEAARLAEEKQAQSQGA